MENNCLIPHTHLPTHSHTHTYKGSCTSKALRDRLLKIILGADGCWDQRYRF